MTTDPNEKSAPAVVADDLVITMHYTLTIDGEVADSSEENGPIQFLQGHGNIVPGLEAAIHGMAVGHHTEIDVPAIDAYGEHDPEAVQKVPKGEFPHGIPLRPGVELQLTDHEGEAFMATILKIGKANVTLDFNHPLAGKDLHFAVSIEDIRPATPAEIEHGHVHGAGEDETHEER